MRDYDYVRTGQVEPPCAVQPPVRTAPDRPGDRDQQQATEFVGQWQRGEPLLNVIEAAIADARDEARAEEAARWQAKIEALADELQRALLPAVGVYVGDRLRALLSGKR